MNNEFLEDMMTTIKISQSGFSLVELMIAIVILAIGLLGLLELQITAMKSNSKSGSIVAAATVAQMAVEEITAVKSETNYLYDNMLTVTKAADTPWPDDPDDLSPLDGGSIDADGDGDIDFAVTFASTPDKNGTGITEVVITVSSLMGGSLATSNASGQVFKDLRRIYN